jgi:hypothetical protein
MIERLMTLGSLTDTMNDHPKLAQFSILYKWKRETDMNFGSAPAALAPAIPGAAAAPEISEPRFKSCPTMMSSLPSFLAHTPGRHQTH